MNRNVIEVQGLSKRYGKLSAVNGVSFAVAAGSAFGLLGLNGAGKTTTLKILTGLIRPDQGSATVAGYDVVREPMAVRRNIGYVSENPGFYSRMSAVEILDYLGRLLEIPNRLRAPRIDYYLNLVGLEEKKHAFVGGFSRGMRHRLSLAQAMLGEPAVLFLDEPTLGLDPAGAKGMRDLINRLKTEREVTILMSSHVLPEVEAICSEVGIFDHGRLIARDSVENLRHTASDSMNLEVVLVELDERVGQRLSELPWVNSVQSEGNRILINVKRDKEVRPQLLEEIFAINKQILSFQIKENSLEDILLRLVKQPEDESYSW